MANGIEPRKSISLGEETDLFSDQDNKDDV
jgi:hypothetical protein